MDAAPRPPGPALLDLTRALAGTAAPPEVSATQALLTLGHLDFSGQVRNGQLMVHRDLAVEVCEIFQAILDAGFPIHSLVPAVQFNWSDDLSMAANNSSGFNYRRAVGKSKLSYHSWGRAIDINPVQNPYIRGEVVLPPGAIRDVAQVGTLLEDGPVVAAFERKGWVWGGRWTTLLDWHHFEKA